MTSPRSSLAPRTHGRALLIGLGLLLLAAVVVAVIFRQPLRYGRMTPPEIALEEAEPALAKRIRALRAQVLEHPYDAKAWGDLGSTFNVHDYPAEAEVCYGRAERLDPGDFRWPYFLGRGAVMTDQETAIAAFRRAAAIRDDYAPLYVHLGRSLNLQQHLDEAEQAYARAVELDPTLIRAHIGLGGVFLERDDARGAIPHLERALALGPKAEEVYWQLAQAHRRLGDAETADRYVALAREQDVYIEPMVDSLWNDLTAAYGVTLNFRNARAERAARAGRHDLALAEWEAAARDDPGSATAQLELGRLRAQLGDVDGAIEALTRGLAIDPDRHKARNNLGAVLVQSGRLREGIEELRRSAEAMPDNADAFFNLAMAWRQAGRIDEAVASLERAIGIDPDHSRARFELGVLLGSLGRFEDAVACFERVVAGGGAPRAAYANLAHALEQLGRRLDAVEVLRAARRARPNDPSVARDLAWRLATSPDPVVRNGAEAVDLMEAVCRATGYRDPRLIDALAAAYAEAGDFTAAVRQARDAIAKLGAAAVPAEVRDALRASISARLTLYEAGRPFREGTGG